MYRFQVRAITQPGERIALVGSSAKLGSWDPCHCIWLQTDPTRYPLWWVELPLSPADGAPGPLLPYSGCLKETPRVEYRYLRVQAGGEVIWESTAVNRWVPLEPEPLPAVLIVEDGEFGRIPAYPYGYFADPIPEVEPENPQGLKVVILGSSVALGCSAWLLRGWAWLLQKALQERYGHQVRNLSELGANVSRTLLRFEQAVIPEHPDVVIVALSLGNEGLASALPQHRRALQRRFENGLRRLIQRIQDIGALPILGGFIPMQTTAQNSIFFCKKLSKECSAGDALCSIGCLIWKMDRAAGNQTLLLTQLTPIPRVIRSCLRPSISLFWIPAKLVQLVESLLNPLENGSFLQMSMVFG